MKRIFTLLLLAFLTGTAGFSQGHINYDRDSKWFIGFNVGGTWTSQTEIKYRVLPGWGFTLGRSFGMLPKSPYCFDIRGRFLAADFAGQAISPYALDTNFTGLSIYGNKLNSYQDSLGYFIPNYRTELVSGSIELVLNTNRLRNKTGWNLYAFGGIGIKGYHTSANLFDGDTLSTSIYNYDNFGGLSKSNILNKQDDIYETDLVGSEDNKVVTWMPSLGFGISYQVAPWCAFGLEHKLTWSRTDNFDGMPNKFSGLPSGLNDIYHYSAASLKFHLFGDEQKPDPDPDVVTNPVDPIVPVTNTPCQAPVIDIFDPSFSNYSTKYQNFKVQATVYYVVGKQNITFKQNGMVSPNFYYDANTDQFSSDVILAPGQNIFEITAQNECGQDYETTIIVLEQEVLVKSPPIVTITNPPYSPYETSNNIFPLQASVLGVDSKAQINVYFNGILLNTFSYNTVNKNLGATLNLMEGMNTVSITASNDVGSDSKTAVINYVKPQTKQPPVVTFTTPSVDPYLSVTQSISVRATVLNVDSKAFITARVNGFVTGDFVYNDVTKEVTMTVLLNQGTNVIELKGVNTAGEDNDVATIIYQKPEVPKPPVVTMIDPAIDPTTVYMNNYFVQARVENVSGAANISLKINGVNSSLFNYSPSSQIMTFNTNLVEGANVILIVATNSVGSDIGTTTIIRVVETPKAPPIVYIVDPYVDNKVFMAPDMTLYAKVLNVDNASQITVLFNGTPTGDFTFASATKDLTLPLTLVPGVNSVTITGTNSAGSDEATRIIIYERPKDPTPPVVVITNPPSTPYLSEIADFTFTANTTNIDSKEQISVLFNGMVVPGAAYTFNAAGQILYNTTLDPGSNVFSVTVTNLDGTSADMAIVNLKEDNAPCIIPTVGYISPVPYSTVSEATQIVDAQINNWSTGTTVEMLLNGVSVGYMTYNAATSLASKTIELTEGSNAVKVIVTNNCGTNFATFTLNYKKPSAPCSEPLLNAISVLSSETYESSAALLAGTMNVSTSDQIKVTVNGTSCPFSFDAGTGTITINAAVIIGNNSIIITAKSDCGTALLTFNVLRKECLKPLISAVTPPGATVLETETANITAIVTNVSASEITLLVNGISQPFSYNEASDALTAAVSLEVGENTIVIDAGNSCGRDKKEIIITRKKPCAPIVVNLISPSSISTVSTVDNIEILLNASGISSETQIKVKFNGVDKTFEFDVVTGNITIGGLTLNDGTNSVNVTLTNECSVKQVDYSIEYKGCKPPVIAVDGMTEGMLFTTAGVLFKATVLNISGPAEILVKHNGTAIDFSYDPSTFIVTAPVTLTEGSNAVWIEARGCETVNKTTNVKYEVPCPDITTSLMIPATTELTLVEPSFEIKLTANGVEKSSEVVAKLNGVAIPFTFSESTKVVEISSIVLADGLNNINVVLQNACSKAEVNYKITYNGCKPPVISFGANPTSVSYSDYHFTAFVSNISNSADLQFQVNGVPSAFIFDPATGAFDADVKLSEGITYFTLTANGCEKVFETAQTKYEIPCEVLKYVLNVPNTLNTAVADDIYTLSLVAQYVVEGDISVMLNGVSVPFAYSGDIVTASSMKLKEGVNTVVVSLKNNCSAETITYTIKNDKCDAPVIDFSSTVTNSAVESYLFNATVSNITSSSKISVKLNGTVVPFSFDPTSGSLTANLTLITGANTIAITANGCAVAEDKILVQYEIPCQAISYTLISPSAANSSDEDGKVTITLNCTEVESSAGITVNVNGSSKPFTFSAGTITISDLSLITGLNAIDVTMTNACSNESVNYTIEYNPCVPPSISLNNSVTKVSESGFELEVTVLNIASKTDIQVTLNGSPVTFEFDPSTHKVTASLSLGKGDNNVKVSANGCENASADYVITYEVPCDPLTYSLMVPSALSATSEVESYSINLGVTNVTKEQISVQHNGNSIPFTLMAGKVIATLLLVEGSNEIIVKMDNNCSSETVTYSVIYTKPAAPCKPLSYNYILPNGNSAAVAEATYYFKLKTFNVVSAADITVKLNGTDLPFDFSDASGMLESKDMPLVEGTNTITVTLKNACSNQDLTFTIDYTKPLQGGLYDCPEDNSGKVTICHFPPGAPDNPQTITIAKAALNTHLDHHDDYCGPCEEKKDTATTGGGCDPITYTLIKPTKLSAIVHTAVTEVMVSAKNIVMSNISATINGAPHTNFTYDEASGLITFKLIPLNSGDNTFKVTLVNECSNEVLLFALKSVKESEGGAGNQSIAPPVITNVAPASGSAEVTTANYAFKAKVSEVEAKANIQILFNGVTLSAFTYTTTTGQVDASLTLKEGANTLKLTATNSNKTVEANYTIVYKKPVENPVISLPPVITNIAPASGSAEVTTATYAFKAKVASVSAKANIQMLFNGVSLSAFTYNTTTGQVDASLTLKEGANTLKLTATNSTKTVEANYTIMYKKPVENPVISLPPAISMINPAGATATVTAASYTMKAKVTNVGSKADITVIVGAKQITTFTYNTADDVLTIPLTLTAGANAVKITATAGGKSVTSTCTITFNQPQGGGIQGGGIQGGGAQAAVVPTIDFVSPLKPTATSTTAAYTIKAKMGNVKTKDQVKLFLNDVASTAFTLDASGNFTTTVTLKSGQNKIKVQATAGGQTVEKIYTITYSGATGGVKVGGGF